LNKDVIDQERKNLEHMDTLYLIDYIKQSVEILMGMKQEEFELFKHNWALQEKMRQASVQREKE
jgi:hypothetical protein